MDGKTNNQKKSEETGATTALSASLMDNITLLKKSFVNDQTVVFREFKNGLCPTIHCCIVFIGALVDKKIVNEHILEPMMNSYLEELIKDSPYSFFRTIRSTERPDIIAEKLLKDQIKQTMHKVQTDFKVDVFGFLNAINRSLPRQWKKDKANSNEIFPNLTTEVDVHISIKVSG